MLMALLALENPPKLLSDAFPNTEDACQAVDA